MQDPARDSQHLLPILQRALGPTPGCPQDTDTKDITNATDHQTLASELYLRAGVARIFAVKRSLLATTFGTRGRLE